MPPNIVKSHFPIFIQNMLLTDPRVSWILKYEIRQKNSMEEKAVTKLKESMRLRNLNLQAEANLVSNNS